MCVALLSLQLGVTNFTLRRLSDQRQEAHWSVLPQPSLPLYAPVLQSSGQVRGTQQLPLRGSQMAGSSQLQMACASLSGPKQTEVFTRPHSLPGRSVGHGPQSRLPPQPSESSPHASIGQTRGVQQL